MDKTNEMSPVLHDMENGFKNHGIWEENGKTEFHMMFMEKISK